MYIVHLCIEREREREAFLPEKLEMLVWFILLLVCFDGYQGVWFFLDVATLVIIHKMKLAKFGWKRFKNLAIFW
jgi:hypothetical protein